MYEVFLGKRVILEDGTNAGEITEVELFHKIGLCFRTDGGDITDEERDQRLDHEHPWWSIWEHIRIKDDGGKLHDPALLI